jgi:two-component system, sporulation sensor kinase E
MNEIKMKSSYYKAIIDNSPDSIVLIGIDHKVLAFNKTIKEVLFNYHHKELSVGDLYYPDFVVDSNKALYLKAFNTAIKGETYVVKNLTSNDNVSLWFEYKMQPVYENEILIGVVLRAKNITIEKEAEREIAELSKKLKAILNNTDEAITLLDTNYKNIGNEQNIRVIS